MSDSTKRSLEDEQYAVVLREHVSDSDGSENFSSTLGHFDTLEAAIQFADESAEDYIKEQRKDKIWGWMWEDYESKARVVDIRSHHGVAYSRFVATRENSSVHYTTASFDVHVPFLEFWRASK